jgi:hypothetical protein
MKMRNSGSLAGIFSKSPEVMADMLSSRELFWGGPTEGLRVLTVYIAYAGRRMNSSQRQSLERVKEMLINRVRKAANGQCQEA